MDDQQDDRAGKAIARRDLVNGAAARAAGLAIAPARLAFDHAQSAVEEPSA